MADASGAVNSGAGRKKSGRQAGRPTGNTSSRAEILAHARRAFGMHGYNGASLRSVAAQAGVDPSTVMHFFGSKQGLFQAVVEDLLPLGQPLREALAARAPGATLVRCYLQIWADEDAGFALRSVIRTSIGSDEGVGLLRESMLRHFLAAADWADPLRAELAIMQLIGLGLGRYIVGLPHLAAAEAEDLASLLGPVLDGVLAPAA